MEYLITFNTPLEMQDALLYKFVPDENTKSFQYSIGDAQGLRRWADPRLRSLSIFYWRCGAVLRVPVGDPAAFNTPLEMLLSLMQERVIYDPLTFQYSIGDAMTYTMETVASFVIFQYSIGDADLTQ